MFNKKKRYPAIPRDVMEVVGVRVKELEDERYGTIRRIVALITGRHGLTEVELSKCLGVFAPDRGTSAVSNWCNAKRERPGDVIFSILELIFFGVIKIRKNIQAKEKLGRRNFELAVDRCKCGGVLARRMSATANGQEAEVCTMCADEVSVNPHHLGLNMERLDAEVQSFFAVIKNCVTMAPELSDMVMSATVIRSHPTGVEIWYPKRSQVDQWTPEKRNKLLDVIDHTFGTENPTPTLVIKQHNLAS